MTTREEGHFFFALGGSQQCSLNLWSTVRSNWGAEFKSTSKDGMVANTAIGTEPQPTITGAEDNRMLLYLVLQLFPLGLHACDAILQVLDPFLLHAHSFDLFWERFNTYTSPICGHMHTLWHLMQK